MTDFFNISIKNAYLKQNKNIKLFFMSGLLREFSNVCAQKSKTNFL